MAPDDRRIRSALDDSLRNIGRIESELRSVNNAIFNLGNDFRNDRRFSSDAYRLRDDLKQAERDVQKVKDRLRGIQRNAR